MRPKTTHLCQLLVSGFQTCYVKSVPPIAAECYGVACLAFARDYWLRKSLIWGRLPIPWNLSCGMRSIWKKDMKKVVDILITQFYSERCKFFWGMENTSASMELGTDHTDFGHSVKTFWVILEVGELLGDPFYIDFARPKIDQILREAYIEENGSWARRFDARGQEGTYYQTRGGSLGVGIPGAMGIQLARPQAEVLAFTGDGGSMYTIQALHTACRLSLPVKMIICNNRRYHLLDQNLEVYWENRKYRLTSLRTAFLFILPLISPVLPVPWAWKQLRRKHWRKPGVPPGH